MDLLQSAAPLLVLLRLPKPPYHTFLVETMRARKAGNHLAVLERLQAERANKVRVFCICFSSTCARYRIDSLKRCLLVHVPQGTR